MTTGIAEVIKYGLIADIQFFSYLEENRDRIFAFNEDSLIHITRISCSIKAEIVRADQKERGKRALLNFGHTVAHGLEALSGYGTLNHGEAVALGMRFASRLSCKLGYLTEEEQYRTEKLFDLYQLPEKIEQDPERLLEVFNYDKKIKEGKLHWILLDEIGNSFVETGIDLNIAKMVLEGLK